MILRPDDGLFVVGLLGRRRKWTSGFSGCLGSFPVSEAWRRMNGDGSGYVRFGNAAVLVGRRAFAVGVILLGAREGQFQKTAQSAVL